MVDVEKLIEEVRQFPVLYDQSSDKYRHSEYKEKIWNIVASNLGTEGAVEECKKKWSSIRDQLRRTLQKRKTKSAQGPFKVYKYKYEDSLAFLFPHLGDLSNMSKQQDDEEDNVHESINDYKEDWTQETSQRRTVYEDDIHGTGVEQCFLSTSSPSTSQMTENPNRFVRHRGIKRKFSNPEDAQDTLSNQLLAYLLSEKAAGYKSPQHPVDAFLAGIAPSLKMLSPHLLIEAKGKIFGVVQEMEKMQLQVNENPR